MTSENDPIQPALVKLGEALHAAENAYAEWQQAVQRAGRPAHNFRFAWTRLDLDGQRQDMVFSYYTESDAWEAFGHLMKMFKHIPRDITVTDEGVDHYQPKSLR